MTSASGGGQDDLRQEVENLEREQAVQAATQAGAQATQAGAQATQAAVQAGQAATTAAAQAGLEQLSQPAPSSSSSGSSSGWESLAPVTRAAPAAGRVT